MGSIPEEATFQQKTNTLNCVLVAQWEITPIFSTASTYKTGYIEEEYDQCGGPDYYKKTCMGYYK